jgi:hypothetical protein
MPPFQGTHRILYATLVALSFTGLLQLAADDDVACFAAPAPSPLRRARPSRMLERKPPS